jgi:hypothetical protein
MYKMATVNAVLDVIGSRNSLVKNILTATAITKLAICCLFFILLVDNHVSMAVKKIMVLRVRSKSWLSALLVACLVVVFASAGNQGNYNYDDDDGAAGTDDLANDDAYGGNDETYNGFFGNNGDYIKYWTDYALLPKRCIV